MNLSATAFGAVDLPERFVQGSAGIDELAAADHPEKIAQDLIEAINRVPRYDDAQRLALSQQADLAGFSDATMYKRYLRLYDDAIADFGRRRSQALTAAMSCASVTMGLRAEKA